MLHAPTGVGHTGEVFEVWTVPDGHPEISMPNGFFQGSPTSLRFAGKLFGEAEILPLAQAYQAATDHHLQHPPLWPTAASW